MTPQQRREFDKKMRKLQKDMEKEFLLMKKAINKQVIGRMTNSFKAKSLSIQLTGQNFQEILQRI